MIINLPTKNQSNHCANKGWSAWKWQVMATLFAIFSLLSFESFGQCQATFSWQPDQADHKNIIFQDASAPSSGSQIVSWTWDFGDGTTSSMSSPTHLYTADGTYNVVLNIVDDQSCQNSFTSTIQVGSTASACEAMFDFSVSMMTLTLTNNSTGSIISNFWEFGDGNTSTDVSPVYTYAQAGQYMVKLTIETSDGCTSSKDILINISGTDCTANFDGTDDPNDPMTVMTFDKSSVATGNITSWLWDFGDGTGAIVSQNATHTYTAAGTYNVFNHFFRWRVLKHTLHEWN